MKTLYPDLPYMVPLTKIANWLTCTTGLITFLIVSSFTENELRHSVFFRVIGDFVASINPGVFRVAMASPFPATTASVFAINALFVPLYLAILIFLQRGWHERISNDIYERVKKIGWIKVYFFAPPVLLLLALTDFGVIPHPQVYPVAMSAGMMDIWQFRLIHSHRLGIGAFYWILCGAEAFLFSSVINIYVGLIARLRRRQNLKATSHI